jgi:predicted nucleotide-binding protein (sugar kinase/HSP70/actin superfamily)
MIFGDLLNRLTLATRPYEKNRGETQAMYEKWRDIALGDVKRFKGRSYKRHIVNMVSEFDNIPVTDEKKL